MGRSFQFGSVVILSACAVCAHAVATPTLSSSSHNGGPRATLPRTPGYLGAVLHDSSNGKGVLVVMVDHDGPAGKAGLRPNDIILSLNGQVIPSALVMSQMIHESSPGAKLTLQVQRDNQTLKIVVQIADRNEVERVVRARVTADPAPPEDDPPVSEFNDVPSPTQPSGSQNKPGFVKSMLHIAPFTGLGLQTMEPQLADFFGDSQGYGLLVQMVMPNSPAAFSGLRAGDVLLRADSLPLKTASDWSKRLRANQGQAMALTVLRDKHEITLNLTPEARHHSMLEWPQMFETLR